MGDPRCQYRRCQKRAVGFNTIRYCVRHANWWAKNNPGLKLTRVYEKRLR
jgi:hypothetical protein